LPAGVKLKSCGVQGSTEGNEGRLLTDKGPETANSMSQKQEVIQIQYDM